MRQLSTFKQTHNQCDGEEKHFRLPGNFQCISWQNRELTSWALQPIVHIERSVFLQAESKTTFAMTFHFHTNVLHAFKSFQYSQVYMLYSPSDCQTHSKLSVTQRDYWENRSIVFNSHSHIEICLIMPHLKMIFHFFFFLHSVTPQLPALFFRKKEEECC